MLKRRSRTVSFRLSDEEYKLLRRISEKRGARSVSDYTRSVACNSDPGEDGNGGIKIDDALQSLNDRMEALDRSIRILTRELKSKDTTDIESKERLT